VTIALIRNAMVRSGAKDFLIDGFPRAMDQALAFEQMIKPCRWVCNSTLLSSWQAEQVHTVTMCSLSSCVACSC
jgi:adenylate kinase family enzyme